MARKRMNLTLGFDVYGTLIDTHGVTVELEKIIGDQAAAFSRRWREKQLEYTFRRGLMRQYQPFGVCTEQALEYTNREWQCALTGEQKSTLMQCYASLPAFPDVLAGLEQVTAMGFQLHAFSNGQADMVETVLSNAKINHYFQSTVSVDAIETFKPNPAVYEYFLSKTGTAKEQAWLISSNGFDVIGAVSTGMKAMWVQRTSAAVLDPWERQPTLIGSSLANLGEAISNAA